jgi:hypothetical protein
MTSATVNATNLASPAGVNGELSSANGNGPLVSSSFPKVRKSRPPKAEGLDEGPF